MLRSAKRCAADPGPMIPTLLWVPALRSSVKNAAPRPGHEAQFPYARVPVNGKLPIGPIPISPEMLSPETLPVNSSVSGIGLVIETFQATSSPFAVSSNISVAFPSATCVPVSLPPEFFKLSVALRSPIGVLIVIFQFPSTAISVSLSCSFPKPEWFRNLNGPGWRYSASRSPSPNRPVRARRSGAGGRANPVGDQDTERDILHGEGRDLRPDQNNRNIERPQFEVPGRCYRDGTGAEREHQCRPGIAREGDIFRNGLGHDRRHVTQHPAALQHDDADCEVSDSRFGQHEAGILGRWRCAAGHDHQHTAGVA